MSTASDSSGAAPSAMSQTEWMDYESLIVQVSDFTDCSEMDGLLSRASLVAELDPDGLAARYFTPGQQPDIRNQAAHYLRRHADWVAARMGSNGDQVEPLRLAFDPEDEQWSLNFDPQLWLLGWRRGDAELPPLPESSDDRIKDAISLIDQAAQRCADQFDKAEMEQSVDLPEGGDTQSLLDLASPGALMLSPGVQLTADLLPALLPLLKEADPVLRDDGLNDLSGTVQMAIEQLSSEIQSAELMAGEGLYGARMDWLCGREDRLTADFYAGDSDGRLSDEQLQRITQNWAEQIEAREGLPFEYVDGFLSAHLISPNSANFDLQHVLFPLFGEQAESLDDQQLDNLINDLGHFRNHLAVRGDVSGAAQLIGAPIQLDRQLSADDDEASSRLGERWSEGFRAGLGYFCPNIGNHLQQDKLLFALMLPLIQLSHQPEGMEFNLSLTDRRELIVGIPETLAEIAKRLEKNAHTPVRRSHSVGRNDPCPCGSGKKYKKCCGAG